MPKYKVTVRPMPVEFEIEAENMKEAIGMVKPEFVRIHDGDPAQILSGALCKVKTVNSPVTNTAAAQQ